MPVTGRCGSFCWQLRHRCVSGFLPAVHDPTGRKACIMNMPRSTDGGAFGQQQIGVGSFLFGHGSGHSIARPIAFGNRVPPQRTVLRETTDSIYAPDDTTHCRASSQSRGKPSPPHNKSKQKRRRRFRSRQRRFAYSVSSGQWIRPWPRCCALPSCRRRRSGTRCSGPERSAGQPGSAADHWQ